jgi:hypothetical protein
LGAIKSDHCPIVLDTNPVDTFYPRPFRFEAAWTRDPRSLDIVKEAWVTEAKGSECFKLYRKQYNTQMALKKWNREVFGHCLHRIDSLMLQIQQIQQNEATEENHRNEACLQYELSEWLLRNEILWRQKSRETWLREGDKNSKYFHLSTIIRRRRNKIDTIKSDLGEWITDRKEIRKHFLTHFTSQFCEEEVDFPTNLEELIPNSISDSENEELCRIPTPQEIKKTLFDMSAQKSPGPDGLPVLFYKKYWGTVGNDVIRAVTNFFISGRLLREVNNTFLVLIPKVQNPTSVNHFRPISLCNVVYKIIAKILVSRLRPLLHKLISPCQSAFIPGRWVAENEVIVQELLHSFKQRKVKGGMMAIKLDLQKAYDKVNWSFLQTVLRNFGFKETFIAWIMECVTSVSFKLLINGGLTDSFNPSRGLRQGDPLSPYLFILCQETLSRLIEKQLSERRINGVKASIGGPAITHVMYADDIILFSKTNKKRDNHFEPVPRYLLHMVWTDCK